MTNTLDNNIQQPNKNVKLTGQGREKIGLSDLSSPQAGQFSRPFVQLQKRHLLMNPVYLPDEDRFSLFYSDSYRKTGYAYVLLEMNAENKPVNAHICRTYETLQKIDKAVKEKGNKLLLHPYPVVIPAGFWDRWKKARTPEQRIWLVKEHRLLSDQSIYVMDRIILDIDYPYEYAKPKLEKVFAELGILEGYEFGSTKSGNLRAVVYFEPLSIHIHNNKVKHFYISGKHLNRFRELLYLIYEMTAKEGIPLDRSFVDRVNHPIWFSYDKRFYERKVKKDGFVRFYDVYSKAKKWQKNNGAYTILGQNLTKKFYPHLWKEQRPAKGKIEFPAFVKNQANAEMSDAFEYWSRAVESLARKVSSHTFTHLILPAIGWAKYLDLDQHTVIRYMKAVLSGRNEKKTDKDLKTAWKVARELEFKLPNRKLPANVDYATLSEQALNYIKQKGQVKRQELLREVFYGQVWLLEKVMNWLEKQGYIASKTEKQGRGRPIKVYEVAINLDDFSHNNNSPKESNDSGLVVDGMMHFLPPETPRVYKGKGIEEKERQIEKEKEKEKQIKEKEQTKTNQTQNINGGQVGQTVSQELPGQVGGQVGSHKLVGQAARLSEASGSGQDFSHNNNPDPDKELLDRLQELIQQKRKLWQERQEQVNRSDKEQAVRGQELPQAVGQEQAVRPPHKLLNPPGCQVGQAVVSCEGQAVGCQADDGWADDVLDIISDYL